jgi:FkbM family methyltransferase
MKRSDLIKLNFSRSWNLPGKTRISKWLHPSAEVQTSFKNGITWLSNENIAIYTSADNYIEYCILSNGDYEGDICKLINISLRPGFIALDIGANIGLQTMRMSRCVGKTGMVYSFEPIAYLQKKFKQNIALNNCDNVKLFPLALSDKADTLTMTVNEKQWNQGTFSLSREGNEGVPQQIAVKVADDIEEIKNIERLDLVKIDVEGFEYHVLRGLKATLKKHRPRLIFEYDKNYWLSTGQHLTDCIAFLTELNYTIFQVTSVGCELLIDIENVGGYNLFCIPKNIGDTEE